MKQLSKILIITVLSVFLVAGTAMALPILELSYGTTTLAIQDSSALDGLPNAGGVLYNGLLGVFNVNVTTGITKPLIGGMDYPMMDLNSINVSSSGAGTLTIKWTETGFTLPDTLSGFNSMIGGTTSGEVTVSTFLNDTLLSDLGPFSDGAFSDEHQVAIDPAEPFSLAIVATITHDAANITSFDAGISPVPEPTTMLLLGSGLIGLARFGRKKLLFKKG